MAFLLSGERPAAAARASSTNVFTAFVKWVAKGRAARRQRVALGALLDYDEARLEDLGINRSDLFEALEQPHARPGLKLAQRRAATSRNWLNP